MSTPLGALSAVVYQEEGWWIARALEKDICVQARRPEEALTELSRAIAAHIALDLEAKRTPLHAIPPAPPEIFEKFRSACLRLSQRANPLVVEGTTPPVFSDIRLAA